MTLGVFVVVTIVVGVALTGVTGQRSPFIWLAAAAVGLLVAAGTRRVTSGFGGAARRPSRGRRSDDAPADGWRCPLCGGTGLEPGPTGRDAPRRPTCRQCGGRGYVYDL